jgi:hypothetical protein
MTKTDVRVSSEKTGSFYSLAPFPLQSLFEESFQNTERKLSMAKSLDSMFEMIRSSKHPFKQVADRPDKPQKNRYERRKVKHLLHLADWADPQTAS